MADLTPTTKAILGRARDTYGYTKQILVTIEELNELAAVLTKFGRYDTPEEAVAAMHDEILDEYADVLNVLDHIKNIFEIPDRLVVQRAEQKSLRLQSWLMTGRTLKVSTEMREIPDAEGSEPHEHKDI